MSERIPTADGPVTSFTSGTSMTATATPPVVAAVPLTAPAALPVVPTAPVAPVGEATDAGDGGLVAMLQGLRKRFVGGSLGAAVARGSVWSFGINVAGLGAGFIVQLLLARTLRSVQYGEYVYALAWTNLAMVVAKLEFDPGSVRYIGAYSGTAQWGKLRGFLRRSHQIVGSASAIVMLVAAAIVFARRDLLPAGRLSGLLIACLIIPATALLLMQVGVLQGFRQVVRAQLPNQVVRPLLFGTAIAVLAWGVGVQVTAIHALWLQLGAALTALALSSWFLRGVVPPAVHAAEPEFHTREWLRTSGALLFIAGANLVLSAQADLLIVGTLLGPQQAGIYGVANQLAMLVGFGVSGVLFTTAPMISSLHAQGRPEKLQRLVTLATRINIAISLPVIPLLFFFGRPILGLFGAEFTAGYPILVLLGLGMVIASTTGALSGFLMTMTGHQNTAGVVIGVSAALNLVLTLILTQRFGAVGTASATAIAGLVRAIALGYIVWRRLGIAVLPVVPRAALVRRPS